MRGLSFLVLALSTLPATAAAQDEPVILIVDPGPARVDVEGLRSAIAEATGRAVVGLADERAAGVTRSLQIAYQAPGMWVVRLSQGDRVDWSTHETGDRPPEPTLVAASAVLLHDPAAPVTAERSWVDVIPDVVDPFAERWNPLREAIDGELMYPFAQHHLHGSWCDLADPFAGQLGHGVFDPWANGEG